MAEDGQTQSGKRPRGVRRAEGLSRPLEAYAQELGYSVRALKLWRKIGNEATPPDPCPLDDYALLPAWWSRRMKQNVPARIVDAVAKFKGQAVTVGLPLFAAAPPVEHKEEAKAPERAVVVEDAEVGLSASLSRIRKAEAAASRAYLEAIQQKDDAGVIEQRRRAWDDALESLRKLEKDGMDILRKSGETVTKSDLKAVLLPLHRALATGIRSFLRRVRPKLEGLNPTEQDRVWSQEAESLFRRLNECQFSGPIDA